MKHLLIIILILIAGCAGTPIDMKLSDNVVAQMDKIYSPMRERGFCVTSDGIHNILIGGLSSCPVPLCGKDDIVFHTHPFWAENGANFFDLSVWKEYHERYGNAFYGVMYGKGAYKVYKID